MLYLFIRIFINITIYIYIYIICIFIFFVSILFNIYIILTVLSQVLRERACELGVSGRQNLKQKFIT